MIRRPSGSAPRRCAEPNCPTLLRASQSDPYCIDHRERLLVTEIGGDLIRPFTRLWVRHRLNERNEARSQRAWQLICSVLREVE